MLCWAAYPLLVLGTVHSVWLVAYMSLGRAPRVGLDAPWYQIIAVPAALEGFMDLFIYGLLDVMPWTVAMMFAWLMYSILRRWHVPRKETVIVNVAFLGWCTSLFYWIIDPLGVIHWIST